VISVSLVVFLSRVIDPQSRRASVELINTGCGQERSIHPTYQAMIEVGRAQRTVFVARYLRDATCNARSMRD
jgi:TnpA family transposase